MWIGDADHYHELIDDACVMVLPAPPFVLTGAQAIDAVADTPRWQTVTFSDRQVMRPEEGLIVIAYRAHASRDGADAYDAFCTTTMRRLEHDVWRVVQHQQTVPIVVAGHAEQ
nr:DUF4440 domain-containing protein [Polymorphobacter fuscus]